MNKKTKPKKTGKLILTIFLLVFLLALAKIVAANVLATTGSELARIESEALALKEERQLLEGELVRLSTLTRISQEAEKLGFGKGKTVVFWQEQIPVALR